MKKNESFLSRGMQNMEKKITGLRILAVAMVAVLMAVGMAGSILAADTGDSAAGTTKIYYQNENNWSTVNIWAWTIKDNVNLAKNAWPGDKMTDLGNGWFSFELPANETFGVLFNDGTNQTANCMELEAGKTYWITNSATSQKNDSGLGGGNAITAVTQAQAGWPEGPATTTAASQDKSEEPVAADAVTDETAKKGSDLTLVYVGIVILIVVAAGAVIQLKKKKGNE